MGGFVLDTSIALKWFLEDESDRGYSMAILNSISLDPLARVRRAVMLQGDITPIARILREKGEAGLSQHDVTSSRCSVAVVLRDCKHPSDPGAAQTNCFPESGCLIEHHRRHGDRH